MDLLLKISSTIQLYNPYISHFISAFLEQKHQIPQNLDLQLFLYNKF